MENPWTTVGIYSVFLVDDTRKKTLLIKHFLLVEIFLFPLVENRVILPKIIKKIVDFYFSTCCGLVENSKFLSFF